VIDSTFASRICLAVIGAAPADVQRLSSLRYPGAELVSEIAGPSLTRVVLGHLSSDCNTPDLAARVIAARLRERGHTDVTVECAGRDAPLPLVPVVHEAIYRARFSEEIPAKSARVCEPVCAAANSPAPLAPEWNQTEWAF
jgi:hypothetical protein